jgi:hypothetical protein
VSQSKTSEQNSAPRSYEELQQLPFDVDLSPSSEQLEAFDQQRLKIEASKGMDFTLGGNEASQS